jgi:hypothetical protein
MDKLSTIQAVALVRQRCDVGLREACEVMAAAGLIKRMPGTPVSVIGYSRPCEGRCTGGPISLMGGSYRGPDYLSRDEVLSLCDGHNWQQRQLAIYGTDQCRCGSGLSPEECCG